MSFSTIDFTVADGVARLRLAQPDTANGISLAMARELQDAVGRLQAAPGLRVVLLTGEGRRFCGGGDVSSFAAADDLPAHLREITAALHVAVSGLVRLDAPVVTLVQGAAAGAGIGLVGASDIVVAAASAKFVLAYAGIGLSPDGSSSWFLPRAVGTKRALDMAITNRALTAEEALEWGLVSRVVPDDELEAQGEALVAQLAAGPTGAFGAAKRLLRAAWSDTLESHMALEADTIAARAATSDAREGIAAFVEKRPPRFTGD